MGHGGGSRVCPAPLTHNLVSHRSCLYLVLASPAPRPATTSFPPFGSSYIRVAILFHCITPPFSLLSFVSSLPSLLFFFPFFRLGRLSGARIYL